MGCSVSILYTTNRKEKYREEYIDFFHTFAEKYIEQSLNYYISLNEIAAAFYTYLISQNENFVKNVTKIEIINLTINMIKDYFPMVKREGFVDLNSDYSYVYFVGIQLTGFPCRYS